MAAARREDLTVSGAYVAPTFTYLADGNGRICGFYAIHATDAMSGWPLEHLWILPDSMARGIAPSLLRHAIGVAAARGVKHLTIDVEPYAEQVYITCGARRVGIIDAPLDGNPSRQRPQMLLASCSWDRD